MVTKKDILNMGEIIKNYFVKNKTYPKTIKIGNTEYTIQQATYLMSSIVAKNQDNVSKINVGGAKSPSGDRVNRKVIKSVYKDMAKRCCEYIEKEKRLPNFITIDGKQKCSIILFMLQLAKITTAMKKGAYPDNILINSADLLKPQTAPSTPKSNCTNPYKAIPFNENSSCDAMGQNTGYFCACSMVQKMMYRLGYKVGQSELAQVMGTTTDGTGHSGIETGIAYVGRKYGVKFDVKWYSFSDLGWEKMGKLMCQDNTSVGTHVLYRDRYGHYEYPLTVNMSTKMVKIINSLGSKCTASCYCGYIEERSFSEHQRYMNGISQKSVLVITKK